MFETAVNVESQDLRRYDIFSETGHSRKARLGQADPPSERVQLLVRLMLGPGCEERVEQ